MDFDRSALRIGIVDHTAAGWVAASTYSRMTLRSLEAASDFSGGPELFFLSADRNDNRPQMSRAKSMPLTSADYLPAERQLRKLLNLPEKSHAMRGEARLRKTLRLAGGSDVFAVARQNKIDVLLPLLDLPTWKVAPKTIGWIPDFQHLYLPEFFSDSDLERRNATCNRVAERASLIMLSSQAARDDFESFAPEFAEKGRVVSFPSLLAFDALTDDPAATRIKFHLPEKFALIANQFWAHKNHALVIKALGALCRRGINIPVVMTGLPSDHRDPSNKNLSSLLQAIATANLNGQITILGLVPYTDLVNLMRTAALIIQPSRFEGWSTLVQDAVALGRPILCSDIPVHHEQVPGSLGFFATDDAESFAQLITTHWEGLTPGPNLELEKVSLAAERDFSVRHGKALLKLCEEAVAR